MVNFQLGTVPYRTACTAVRLEGSERKVRTSRLARRYIALPHSSTLLYMGKATAVAREELLLTIYFFLGGAYF